MWTSIEVIRKGRECRGKTLARGLEVCGLRWVGSTNVDRTPLFFVFRSLAVEWGSYGEDDPAGCRTWQFVWPTPDSALGVSFFAREGIGSVACDWPWRGYFLHKRGQMLQVRTFSQVSWPAVPIAWESSTSVPYLRVWKGRRRPSVVLSFTYTIFFFKFCFFEVSIFPFSTLLFPLSFNGSVIKLEANVLAASYSPGLCVSDCPASVT